LYGSVYHRGRRAISAVRPFSSRGLSFLFLAIWFSAQAFGQLNYDLNDDNTVNFLDFAIFADRWCEGDYGLPELAAFSQEWLEEVPPPGAASNPSPDNGAIDVNLTQDLSWTAGSGATSHDVYFGTANPPPFIGNQTDTTYDTGTMSYNTTYYWRVDEKNVRSTTTGIVWSFTTIPAAPGAAGSPIPVNGATDVSQIKDLSWTAGSGVTSHDVYFGTANPPPFIGNQTGTTYDTGTMATDTTYYWCIDEKNSGGTTEGTVWNFTTLHDSHYVRSVSVSNPTGSARYHHSLEIVLDPNFNWEHIDTDFTTLRFYDSQNNLLDYWIEYLDYANQKAVIWVRIPQLDTAGTLLTMEYSPAASESFQSQSYTAMLKRPPSGFALETYPKDEHDNNLSCLHPCVVRAQGWLKNSVSDANDIQWVMVNTPYPQDQPIDWPWTIGLCENPALWVCEDPNAQTGWRWPTGYTDWPQACPGPDSFAKEMKRYDSVLHNETIKSNLLVAPSRLNGIAWRDPTMVWLPELNGGTLRVYFQYGTGDLYYLDLTSSGNSWADSNGTNMVYFGGPDFNGPKICSIRQGDSVVDFTSSNAREPGTTELVCPSILLEDGVWYMVTACDKNGQLDEVLQKWSSPDGIVWTKDPQRPAIDYPTGIIGPPWHFGVLAYQGRWFMLGNTGVITGSIKSHMKEFMWVSEDQGRTWLLQLPKCLPRQHVTTGYPEDFVTPYRFWPVYEQDMGLMVFAGFWNSKAGSFYSFGGTCLMRDPDWSPVAKRPMPSINSVFWLYGLDFGAPLFAGHVTNSSDIMEWPEVIKKRLVDGITTDVIDKKLLVSGQDYCGIQTFGFGPNSCHYRLRADCDPTIGGPGNIRLKLGNFYHIALDVNPDHLAIVKLRDPYNCVLGTVNSSSAFGTAGTYDYRTDLDSKKAWLNVFRMESQDYLPIEPMPATITTPISGNYIFSALDLNQSKKWFGLYFAFARPGMQPEDEPSAELGIESLQP